MKFTENAPSGGGNEFSALYPPTTLKNGKSIITGFLEGIGIESFKYDERGWANLTVYKEIPGTDNKKYYSRIVNSFFASESQYNTVMSLLKRQFLAVEPEANTDALLEDLETLEDAVKAFNTCFTFPSPMVENAVAKIVFRTVKGAALSVGVKANYDLSGQFPAIGLKDDKYIIFKNTDKQWGDCIEFSKEAPQTDGMLSPTMDFTLPTVDSELPF